MYSHGSFAILRTFGDSSAMGGFKKTNSKIVIAQLPFRQDNRVCWIVLLKALIESENRKVDGKLISSVPKLA